MEEDRNPTAAKSKHAFAGRRARNTLGLVEQRMPTFGHACIFQPKIECRAGVLHRFSACRTELLHVLTDRSHRTGRGVQEIHRVTVDGRLESEGLAGVEIVSAEF